MKRIREKEFLKIIKELQGKNVIVELDGSIQGKILLEDVNYEMPCNSSIITLQDKAKNNSIYINLSLYYKITANEENSLLQVYYDNDIFITIKVK